MLKIFPNTRYSRLQRNTYSGLPARYLRDGKCPSDSLKFSIGNDEEIFPRHLFQKYSKRLTTPDTVSCLTP
ncbi:MAG: hypothetical protein LM590_12630 [Thermofilum sp.]|nr:hypothetical protein [Thermofilum sp.]